MRLVGWNEIPEGYGASFALHEAPPWLRWWFHTPFVDRFAYPLLVRRGNGWLLPHPGWPTDRLGVVSGGWRIRPAGHLAPGSSTYLRPRPPRP